MTASIRNNVKKNRISVGDKVSIIPNEYDKGKFIITKVETRKNSLIRPVVANIDKLIVVIAPRPEPDLYLVDKLIIYCYINNIEPIIVLNKCDICSQELLNSIKNQYKYFKVFVVSAKDNQGIDDLKNYIENTLCVLSGQSAVGKSSLLNCLIPSLDLETQELSTKIDRGKHTTRVCEIFVNNNIMIADTPGFTSLDLNIDYRTLADFYPEFDNYRECKYIDCSHIKEGNDCMIFKNVENGKINKDRYLRYTDLYKVLKDKWEKKYD